MYYLLSGYICVVYCIVWLYIYNYIFYLFIDLCYLCCLKKKIFIHMLYCIVSYLLYIYIEIIYHFRDQTLPPPAWLQVAAASYWALRSLLWATPRQLSETQQRGLRMGKRQWKVELSVEGLVSYKKWWDKYGIYLSIYLSVYLSIYLF